MSGKLLKKILYYVYYVWLINRKKNLYYVYYVWSIKRKTNIYYGYYGWLIIEKKISTMSTMSG